MSTKKRITLSDISELTGFSKITVSRAFSNPGKLSTQTAERIHRVANELGYTPNRAASLLRTKSSKMIGVVNPNMSNPFFGSITKCIAKHARNQGYNILMFDSYENEEMEKEAINDLISYGADGIILSVISSSMHYAPAYLQTLEKNNIPLVLLDRELTGSSYNGVYIDNLDSGNQLGNAIVNDIPQDVDIEIIAGPKNSLVSQNRISGLRAALYAHRINIHHADFNFEPAYHVAMKLLKQSPLPKVLVGLNNQIMLGILKAMSELGLKVQKDVTLYCIDKVPYSDIFGLNIPCIDHNLDEIAYQATSLIIRAINGDVSNDFHNKVMIQGKFSRNSNHSL